MSGIRCHRRAAPFNAHAVRSCGALAPSATARVCAAVSLALLWTGLAPTPAHPQVYRESPLRPVAGVFPEVREAWPLSRAEERALVPGDHFKECRICPEMVVVPAGEFIMGAPLSEEGSAADESPQRTVTIAHAFAVGRFAITFDEWENCVASGGCKNHWPADRGWGRGRRPVINIWWEDARAYTAWLSQRTGQSYRLLTEAEREYVARAGTRTPFWWGQFITTDQANYDGTFGYPKAAEGKGAFRRRTLPVESFEPNPWGLYQVHGNVYEWVEDCWHGDYVGAPADGSAWVEPDCRRRVMRGGSYNFAPWHLRAAARGQIAAAAFAAGGVLGVGLRVARSVRRD
jgi:formylglycine-generating enzyme required for sulfatase activity